MLIVTSNSIPGYQIDAVLGEVMGLTVRSANIGQNILAGFKALGGGEVSQYTDLVYDSRNQVMQRMWDMCVQRGGNAIIAMRFDTGDIGQTFSEVCAYGTAVVVRPIADAASGGTPQSINDAHNPAPAQPQPQAAPQPQQPVPPQPGVTPYGYPQQS